jgi:hypothetical protein
MHLQEARLCLDCEELHTDDRCPRCASDAFAFVTRWIPANERRIRSRRPTPSSSTSSLSASTSSKWLTGAAGGLAAIAAVRWLWRAPASSPRPRGPSRQDDSD